jgi:Protein of unknown function (DUF3619)
MTNLAHQKSDLLQDRFGLKAASFLASSESALPYDLSERLRAARTRAVASRKVEKTHTASTVLNQGGSAVLQGGDGFGFWGQFASFVPLVALVVGMLLISAEQSDSRAKEVAEVDVALLTDDLPPAAFSDAGFVQFLKTSR